MSAITLQSANIRLLPVAPEHRQAYSALANIAELNRRINKPFPYSDTHFDAMLAEQGNRDIHVWMMECSQALIGVVNMGALRHPRVYQGGYWVHPAHQGKGLASQAVALVRDYLFAEKNAVRLQALVEPDNPASIRVLEKCGYECEGLLRKFYAHTDRDLIDVYMYACVKS